MTVFIAMLIYVSVNVFNMCTEEKPFFDLH